MDGPSTHRSHPSLHHLTLNPLTTSSIPPTPSSPTLPPTTPSSYISPAPTLPPTYPSILSRSSSRTKLPSLGSTPVLEYFQTTHHNNTSSKSRPGSRHHSRRGTSTGSSAGGGGYDADSSWLTRTASTLAMQSLEERGQSWLASRNSATSLHHLHQPYDTSIEDISNIAGPRSDESGKEVKATGYPRSAPASRHASRVHSRVGSRVGSRSDLRMTRTELTLSPHAPAQYGGAQNNLPAAAYDIADVEPDFVNLDERDREEQDDVVDLVDEGEMRKLVLGRVGGWVDWMVGWMDFRGSRDEDEGDDKAEEEEDEKENGDRKPLDGGGKGEVDRSLSIPAPAPDEGGGVWEDARWLVKIALDSL
ncbi:MAG: hypothetical protein Q9176_002453 [Flavoplaca citrina]